ncbi:uncharacterized protein [Miscanthus floridulus]|uniref:uncharacterized protein n=1 Tax=Miscanthus floridulus TaxID=154761 RepID=UPI003459C856
MGLLKKEGFTWNEAAAAAFVALKTAITTAPRLATIPQHHWVGKLLGFNFFVEYKAGSTNMSIISDRDPMFTSIFWKELLCLAGVKLHMTTAFHPFPGRLEQAQDVYKRFYDKHHRDVHYSVGDWVWLRLRHRAPASLHGVTKGKLRPRCYGSYHISDIINDVAYRLEPPPRAWLHDVFYVRLLKKFVGTPPATPPRLCLLCIMAPHCRFQSMPHDPGWPEASAKS